MCISIIHPLPPPPHTHTTTTTITQGLAVLEANQQQTCELQAITTENPSLRAESAPSTTTTTTTTSHRGSLFNTTLQRLLRFGSITKDNLNYPLIEPSDDMISITDRAFMEKFLDGRHEAEGVTTEVTSSVLLVSPLSACSSTNNPLLDGGSPTNNLLLRSLSGGGGGRTSPSSWLTKGRLGLHVATSSSVVVDINKALGNTTNAELRYVRWFAAS